MGLAEPRKRLKIAHDPRNLQWSDSTPTQSFGKRLMQAQGWQQGQSLGARSSNSPLPTETDSARLAAARVGVIVKDDNLGLGARLKSKDVQHQKTGLDAFQGLLGRLNSKTEEELQAVQRKQEDRNLEMYARGRWGGMVFVRGGVLVQGEEFKRKQGAERRAEGKKEEEKGTVQGKEEAVYHVDADRVRGKAEKRSLNEERRARKEERKAAKAAAKGADSLPAVEGATKISPSRTVSLPAPDEPKSSSDEEADLPIEQLKKRRRSSVNAEEAIKKQVLSMKNGRHILRGRNIEAKRKAFSDAKGLDAIFMKTS